MENKEIKNIGEFFSRESKEQTPEEKWNSIFKDWVLKIEEKQKLLSLFELKLWFESIEDFINSSYISNLIFKTQDNNIKDYCFYAEVFSEIISKIIKLLKELDFIKDEYVHNFEEFIVEKILTKYPLKSFSFLKKTGTPDSWFSNLRIYLQKLKNLAKEISKTTEVTSRSFNSLLTVYHMELGRNPILVSLLSGKFIPKLDKIYQNDITEIILAIEDKSAKRNVGVFFVLAFRIIKINNFIEFYLYKTGSNRVTIPLIIVLKKYIEKMLNFYESVLKEKLLTVLSKSDNKKLEKTIKNFDSEYKKIFEGELLNYFNSVNANTNKNKIIKNIHTISDFALQELIENTAAILNKNFAPNTIFENRISRKERALDVKKQLTKIIQKIENYFSSDTKVSPSEIFFDLTLFIETDLHYLLYKDWNEFLKHHNNLANINFSSEFEANLVSLNKFLINLKENITEN